MALRITFGPGEWENTGLVYAYSWRFRELPRFRQEKDCIANSAKQGDPGDYDYMGLMLPETYTAGAKIGIRCAFENNYLLSRSAASFVYACLNNVYIRKV